MNKYKRQVKRELLYYTFVTKKYDCFIFGNYYWLYLYI